MSAIFVVAGKSRYLDTLNLTLKSTSVNPNQRHNKSPPRLSIPNVLMGAGASANPEPPPFETVQDAIAAGKTDAEIDVWMAENLRQELVQDLEERFRSLRGAFRKIDADQSGFIDVEELKKLCTNYNLPTEHVSAVFDSLDVDKDGKIVFSEFSTRLSEKIKAVPATTETKVATPASAAATSSFVAIMKESEAKIGLGNILDVESAKAFVAESGEKLLFLDVQDPGSAKSDKAYNASLGTLFYKADKAGPAPDATICAQHPSGAILVACAAGGQAKIGAALLMDYGYTNVKVLNGACIDIA